MKILIIGGGFAGLNAALALKNAPVDILLIDKTNHHLFQPLLYQVATAVLSPGNIASPIREILAKQNNTTVLLAEIVKIDKLNHEVIAANGEHYPYDYLILAPGTRHSYFGHDDWEPFAPGLKTLDDALKIRERILLSYERAERCESLSEATKFMSFVIIGGGPTGVEMAGSIGEIAHKTLVTNFRHIKPEQTKIYLIEGESQVLPSFPKDLAEKARIDLEKLGVQVYLNSYVTNVTATGVRLGDQFIESPNIIWAAGNAASPLLKSLDIPLDRSGRAIVKADLTVPNHPEIFVIGDAAALNGADGKPLPGVAPVAIQQGRYVAKLLSQKNLVEPDKRPPFKYRDKGMMATIGKAKAVAKVGKLKMSGYPAWLMWSLIHIVYLITFSNKLLVMIQWFYLYLSNQRRIRLITRPIGDQDDPI